MKDEGSTCIPNVTNVVAKKLASFMAAVSIYVSLAKVSVSVLHSLTEYQPIRSFLVFRVPPALNLTNLQFYPQLSFFYWVRCVNIWSLYLRSSASARHCVSASCVMQESKFSHYLREFSNSKG